MNMKKIGILGGTFNPVHVEHVNIARSAINELQLDKLIVMPTFISPHKDRAPAPAIDRLNMLKLAFKNVDKVEVSDYEILKQGKSYTYLTVEHFKKSEDCELFFIVGEDMLVNFKTWKNPDRILDSCTLAVFGRQDVFADFDKEREYFIKTFGKEFIRLSYQGKEISSTKIRVYSEFSLPTEFLPQGVSEYIKQKGLFAPDKYQKFIIDNLPYKRVKHTADVVVCALKRAKELNLDEDKVALTATLHDCAKYIDYKTVEGFSLPENVPAPVVHAFLGAYIAEKVLGVTDKEILDAIRYHTSGRANMSTLEKLIFVADMVEEGRTYEGVGYLRGLYEKEDFEHCFRECLKEEVVHLINKKQYIYEKTLEAYDYYKQGSN